MGKAIQLCQEKSNDTELRAILSPSENPEGYMKEEMKADGELKTEEQRWQEGKNVNISGD